MAQPSVLRLRSPNPGSRRAALVDFFYHWFSELEAQGEDTTFRLGRVCGTGEPTWVELPHHSFDGLGGLAHALTEHSQAQLELPQLSAPYPAPLQRWVAALRLLFRRPPSLLAWRPGRQQLALKERPVAAWELLTAGQTSELRERARTEKVSMNALLLHALTQVLAPLLEPGAGNIEWVVPINMRGLEPDLAATDNQAATLDVYFPINASPAIIDGKLQEELRRNAHFGVWQLLRALGAWGPRSVRALARRELKVRKHGSFSNLGNLQSSLRSSEPHWWMAFNPVQRTRPVGAACLTFHGRLSLTLNIHPALGLDVGTVQQLVSHWRHRLLAAA